MVSRSGGRAIPGISSRRDILVLAASLAGCTSRPKMQASSDTEPVPPPPTKTRILLGGDVMLSRYVGRNAHQRNDPAWPFREIAPVFQSADIAFINLESPFTERKRPCDKGMVFGASADMMEGLRLAGIDLVSTANNHARDGGNRGVEFTLQLLKKNGIAAAGTGFSERLAHEGVILVRNGVRFGFLAYTYDQRNGNHKDDDERVAVMDIRKLLEDVECIRTRTDVVIVSMHAGVEYHSKPNAHQIAFAHAAIDCGASVVAGHHPHVVQTVEKYKGGVIFYSLGNLIFDQSQPKGTSEGLLADVTFNGNRLDSFVVKPIVIRNTVPKLLT